MLLESILSLTHSLLRQTLKAGGCALDAMVGSGHDILLLVQLVDEMGKVWAPDVQPKTLAQTQGRLKENGVDGRVALIHDDHENLPPYIGEPLDAAVFNSGWLSGGDKSYTTEAASSIRALTDTLGLLKEGGLAVAAPCPGYEADWIEAEVIMQWTGTPPQEASAVLCYGFVSRCNVPLHLLAVEKLRRKQMSVVK